MASNQDIADMSALIKTLQNRLVDLENTNSTSVAMSPSPPTHAPRDPLFKVDLCLYMARNLYKLGSFIALPSSSRICHPERPRHT
jgi:hypothetical protein